MLKLVRTSASHHSPPTTHHHRCCRRHHNHLLFQLLLKVFIVARVISKRLNPGAAEDWAEDVFVVCRHLPAAEPTPRLPLGNVRDGHVKDAVEDVAEDVTRDVAEDVLGAEEDGPSSVSGGKIIITPVTLPQLPPPPRLPRFLHQRFLHRRAKRSLNVRSPLLVRQAQ